MKPIDHVTKQQSKTLSCPDFFNVDYPKSTLSISVILVSFCSQEYLEHKYVNSVFHKNIRNNLSVLSVCQFVSFPDSHLISNRIYTT